MQLTIQRRSFLGSLPEGAGGTLATLKIMKALVRQYRRDPALREIALGLVAGLRPKDWKSEIRAVFEYVRDSIRYVRDVTGVETIQIPMVTAELEAGDCDDKSVLLASLLGSIGHPSRFVAVGYDRPGAYSHVYVETRHGPGWLALDPTVLQPMGWAPRPPVARMLVHV